MKKLAALLLVVLGCGVGWAQGAMTDSQTLQAILVEMRGIHNDVRLSETTQILLAELEVEHSAVDKAMEKRDNARSRVSQLEVSQKSVAMQIARLEERAKVTLDQEQQRQIADQTDNMKSSMENFKTQMPDAASALQDAENALRKDQETLSGIQEQLDEVVKKLQPVEK